MDDWSKFPVWKGFELAPTGYLLDQSVDISGPMGVAYERCVGFYKDFHTHDRLMFICPRGSCAMEVRTRNPQDAYRIDAGTLLTLPAQLVHDDEGVSTIYDTLALYPAVSLLDRVCETASVRERLFSGCQKLSRSPWLDQLLTEYFARRVLAPTDAAEGLGFFEQEIVREVVKLAGLAAGTETDKSPPTIVSSSPVTGDEVDHALLYVETHLFEPMTSGDIALHSKISESTLARRFKKRLNKTPSQYIRERRLDEARLLLDKGRHSVGDVAVLVGYENFGAFSTAFRRRFGQVPSKQGLTPTR